MAVDLAVKGADEVAAVSRALRAVDDKELRREFYKGINRATKPMRQEAKDNAARVLPKRGGLNQFVAKSRLSARTRGGKNPGVRIVASKGSSDIAAIDRGRLRHPVFGNRKVWVTQRVTPGWFTDPMEKGERHAQKELLDVLDDVKDKIKRA